MPNWCTNKLYVRGAQEELDKFAERVRGDLNGKDLALSFQTIAPQPEGLEKEVPLFGSALGKREPLIVEGWYAWRLQNWGTKWDLADVYTSIGTEEILYEFDTAWSPPTELIKHLLEKYPALRFLLEYAECGNDFWGVLDTKEELFTEGDSQDVTGAPEWIRLCYFGDKEDEEEEDGSVQSD